MKHIVHAPHGFLHQFLIGDGALNERAVEPVEVVAIAGAEVVEHADFLRDALVMLDDVGTDEAGAAGDEDFHVVC